jgi:hypothetical protein
LGSHQLVAERAAEPQRQATETKDLGTVGCRPAPHFLMHQYQCPIRTVSTVAIGAIDDVPATSAVRHYQLLG